MITSTRKAEILLQLDRIEREYNIQILHAIESGSRAWGFPSADSDYDVRIIYRHPSAWYLSVFDGRDVMEEPVSGDLDISGWDLRKTLRLLAGGNAVVHEWLNSPIVYRQDKVSFTQLEGLAQISFQPRSAFYHYLAMAGKKLDVSAGEAVTAKRFLYGLRSLLCARWVIDTGNAPPMLFSTLLQRYISPEDTIEGKAIDRLIEAKAHGSEHDVELNLGALVQYGQTILAEIKTLEPPKKLELGVDVWNESFRLMLE